MITLVIHTLHWELSISIYVYLSIMITLVIHDSPLGPGTTLLSISLSIYLSVYLYIYLLWLPQWYMTLCLDLEPRCYLSIYLSNSLILSICLSIMITLVIHDSPFGPGTTLLSIYLSIYYISIYYDYLSDTWLSIWTYLSIYLLWLP